MGASYKGNVGDPRNSPAVEIFEALRTALGPNGLVAIADPHIKATHIPLQPVNEVIKGASLILVLADHDEFKVLDPNKVASTVATKKILDTRNALDSERWEQAGFDVYLLGKG